MSVLLPCTLDVTAVDATAERRTVGSSILQRATQSSPVLVVSTCPSSLSAFVGFILSPEEEASAETRIIGFRTSEIATSTEAVADRVASDTVTVKRLTDPITSTSSDLADRDRTAPVKSSIPPPLSLLVDDLSRTKAGQVRAKLGRSWLQLHWNDSPAAAPCLSGTSSSRLLDASIVKAEPLKTSLLPPPRMAATMF